MGRWDSKQSKTKELINQTILGIFVPFGSIKMTKFFMMFFIGFTFFETYIIITDFSLLSVRSLITCIILAILYSYTLKLVKDRGVPIR